MRRIRALFRAAALAALALPAGCLDRGDPAGVARAVLTAYGAKDFSALAALTHPDNRPIIEEVRRDGAAHPRYASLFGEGSWRWRGVQGWDGRIAGVRTFAQGTLAMVRFGEISPSELLVVVLEMRDGRWWFEDINSPAVEDFDRGAPAP